MTLNIMKHNAYQGEKGLLYIVPVLCALLTSLESCFFIQNITLLPCTAAPTRPRPSWENLFSVAGGPSELNVSVERKKKIKVRNSVALWTQPFSLDIEKEGQVSET